MRLPTFSPDGSRFASVVSDRVIYVWDTITGYLLRSSQEHSARIRSLVLSPDGTQIIYIYGEKTVQLWLVTEDLAITVDLYDFTESAIFFRDGMRFVTSSYFGVRIWDMTSTTRRPTDNALQKPVLVLTLTSSRSSDHISISSNGARLFARGCLWEIVNYQQLSTFDRAYNAVAAKFSPDSTLVALCSNNSIHILDTTTGAELYKLHPFDYNHLSFSLDSTQLLCSSSGGTAHVLNLRRLPTSIDTQILSCVYPQDCMKIQSRLERYDGWYCGPTGARLIWLPDDMRHIWLVTGKQTFGSRCLFLGSGNDVAVLDIDDYLDALPAGVAWREGGVRYLEDSEWFDALMSESGSKNIAFSAPCLGLERTDGWGF